MNETQKIWQNVLNELQLEVSSNNFTMWFKEASLGKIDDGVVYIQVPNVFYQEWLQKKFHGHMLRHFRRFNDQVRSLEYVICDKGDKKKQVEKPVNSQINGSFPLQDYYINKTDFLNPKYTFDTFVVGPFNELAHAASQAIVKKPGHTYNPFFVYGDPGIGKTHLIQAVGNQIKKDFGEKKIFYLTSEKFGNEFLNAMNTGKAQDFKERYRKYDVLIMDDIQFFAHKDKFQEELFHIFNFFHENNKQMVFSSDRHLNYIDGLEDRLKSRFSAGMVINIPSPDVESRLSIIRAKALAHNLILDDGMLYFIAESLNGNIRELEGIMNTINLNMQMKNRPLNILEIKNVLRDAGKNKKTMPPKEVVKIIANYYNIEEDSIYDKTRKKDIVKPRQVIMYILREEFNISYPSIGEKLGGRDHTTVIHSCEKIKNDLKTDSILSQEISQIKALL